MAIHSPISSSQSEAEEGLISESKSQNPYHDQDFPSRLHSLELDDESDHVFRTKKNSDLRRLNPFRQRSRSMVLSRSPRAFFGSAAFAWTLACIILAVAGTREYQHRQQALQNDAFDALSSTVGSLSTHVGNLSSSFDSATSNVEILHTEIDALGTELKTLNAGPALKTGKPDQEGDLPNTQNVAYLSFMTETVMDSKKNYTYDDDRYLIAMRMLVYQLKHQPETRTRRSIPIIVMVTHDVAEEKREMLRKDGAVVWPVDRITDGSNWMGTDRKAWRDQVTKLRAWELVQYDRILYLDNDNVLLRCLDGIFDDSTYNNTVVPTLKNPKAIKADEGEMPEDYLMASSAELWAPYDYPPTHDNIDDPRGKYRTGTNYINGGFFLFKPSLKMAEYYRSVARCKNKFNAGQMEQALLNYAHRITGNMPSKILPMTWNQIAVTRDAVAGKVASVHDKWWYSRAQYKGIQKYGMFIRWRMEAFYELRENYLQSKFKNIKELDGVDLDYHF